MPRRARLDAELVRRGLARSRQHAAQLITEGQVTVRGMVASKPATAVDADVPVLVRADHDDPGWASRGAYKLLGALAAFEPAGLCVAGRRCLDAGASTGGFTDVLLRHGAARVVAADVGRGLLDWRLRTDERVVVLDRTNVRSLTPGAIGGPVELVVADLSFISLRLVLPALLACGTEDVDLVLMVKPQFEVGKDRRGSVGGRPGGGAAVRKATTPAGRGKRGVVRDPALRAGAVLDVLAAAGELGLRAHGVVASPLPGPAGNVEYFAWLRRGDPLGREHATAMVESAVREGPQ